MAFARALDADPQRRPLHIWLSCWPWIGAFVFPLAIEPFQKLFLHIPPWPLGAMRGETFKNLTLTFGIRQPELGITCRLVAQPLDEHDLPARPILALANILTNQRSRTMAEFADQRLPNIPCG